MIARGDLGVEIGDGAAPVAAPSGSARAQPRWYHGDQMMESMIENAIPTRAGLRRRQRGARRHRRGDALGRDRDRRHPVEVIQAADRICREAGNSASRSSATGSSRFTHIDEAVAMAMYTANHLA
jgi:pyruvate kinase